MGKIWDKKHKIDVVFVSPLTRTLQTATNIFKNTSVKMIAVDDIMEYPQSLEYCNKRQKKNNLQIKFPHIDFSFIPEESTYWKDVPKIESLFDLKERTNSFKEFLNTRKEKNICVVSHSTFLKEFLLGDVGNVQEELNYCEPFFYQL